MKMRVSESRDLATSCPYLCTALLSSLPLTLLCSDQQRRWDHESHCALPSAVVKHLCHFGGFFLFGDRARESVSMWSFCVHACGPFPLTPFIVGFSLAFFTVYSVERKIIVSRCQIVPMCASGKVWQFSISLLCLCLWPFGFKTFPPISMRPLTIGRSLSGV